ncbi:haloacid dehalogenase type II [Aquimarina sp. 2-A2]|uniref:haloacid dehalogenase type II n=1 Tax=Aquimarina sp. 2-A2 TaxID=3382644 RepID=UPI00387F19C3
MKKLPKILIFDVNETLLDLSKLKTQVNKALGSDTAFDLWFSTLLHYSLVENATGIYKDFGAVGKNTLRMVSKNLHNLLDDASIDTILSNITNLSPHPEVKASLQILKDSGFILIALTNGGQKTVEAQLEYAELTAFFDKIISVEQLKKFKPYPNTYQYVLDLYSCTPEEALLIAAHGWDIYGAQMAGLQTGFIARPGKNIYDISTAPEYVEEDLAALTKRLTSQKES